MPLRRLLALAVLLVGCGGTVPALLGVTASASVGVSTGYRLTSAANKTRQDEIRVVAKTDQDQADRLLDAWILKVKRALQVLDAASVTVESAYAAIPAVERALDKKQQADLIGWIKTLVKLGVDVSNALADVGVKVPVLDKLGSAQ